MITLGLDLSLTETGFAIIEDGKIVDKGVITSKPKGKRPVDEIRRIREIVRAIAGVLAICKPDMVAIEGLAFMARNTTALVQLSGLNYMVRDLLDSEDIPFLIIAPTSLKKFVTGKGNAQKDQMMLESYKRWGVSILNNNEADAYGLAQLALAFIDKERKITSVQREVIELIITQI